MQPFEHGIHAVDTGFHRPRFDASHLVIEDGRAAFVDAGVNRSVPRLLAALAAVGLAVEAVDWLILTHVHLDHAGGAGALLRELPNARLVVHPRGARHMADPSALVAGASAVYGADSVRETYGELLPVPASRIDEAPDGHVVHLAGRPLICLDTPGHARHHLCVWDARSRAFFTGDTFGLSYRELDSTRGAFIVPTTTPVQFDPVALKASVARLLAHAPQAMFLTHYSRVGDVTSLADDLLARVDAMVAIARRHAGAADRHARLVADFGAFYVEQARTHGSALTPQAVLDVLAMDIELNAQGLEVWLDRGAA